MKPKLKCEYDYDKVFKKKMASSVSTATALIELPKNFGDALGWRHNDVLEWFRFWGLTNFF